MVPRFETRGCGEPQTGRRRRGGEPPRAEQRFGGGLDSERSRCRQGFRDRSLQPRLIAGSQRESELLGPVGDEVVKLDARAAQRRAKPYDVGQLFEVLAGYDGVNSEPWRAG